MSVPGKYRRSEYNGLLWGDDKINGIVDNLKSMGLTEYESKALCALFLKKEATAPEISDFAGIPNTKLYYVLEGLEKHGLIKSKDGRPKRFYVTDPEEVLDRIGEFYFERFRRFKRTKKETLDMLREVAKSNSMVLEMKGSVKLLRLDVEMAQAVIMLKRHTKVWYGIANHTGVELMNKHKILQEYTIERLRRDATLKIIVPDDIYPDDPWYSRLADTKNAEVRMLPPEQIKFNFMIGDDKIAGIFLDISPFTQDIVGVLLVDSKAIATGLKYFLKEWERARRWLV